jgi:pyroglutamyl-peptidase
MKKLLITAFEPFNGRGANPALLVMARLKPAAFRGWRVIKHRMPVDGRTVSRLVPALIARHKPDVMISFGLAAGEASVRVERFALNVQDYNIKDNAGYKPEGKMIRPEGPAAYFVGADPLRLAAAMRRAKVPAYVSNYAGAYVCNHLMYEALHAIAVRELPTRFAFIHLPLTMEMALPETSGKAIQPSLPLPALVKAAEAAIKAAL